MPSEVRNSTTEKPHHYTYLKEFRTEQCQLFLQHKCTQHRPFTCFNWHFLNQRRRRPSKKNGKFSYSPDIYCTKYDETSGICPSGEDCQYLHRTAGDTERRYHLRYYKTSPCVHETDLKGYCVKNGPHCAFAHGDNDLRQPVYDESDMVTDFNDKGEGSKEPGLAGSQLEKDRAVNEDAQWSDTTYVLNNYKTEPCKRPPRLCRQGYACPSYHNSKDRRRPPRQFKYRSTPCPDVKINDDWGDPSQCSNGDSCSYCHTRTEQQFHPEIYKSSKCNDAMQTGFCPRASFCAFAHVENEMNSSRELSSSGNNTLAAFVESALPASEVKANGAQPNDASQKQNGKALKQRSPSVEGGESNGIFNQKDDNAAIRVARLGSFGQTDPIIRQRMRTASGSMGIVTDTSLLQKAPGCEREDTVAKLAKIRQSLQQIENDSTLDEKEKARRKNNVHLLYGASTLNGPTTPSHTISDGLPGLTTPLFGSVGSMGSKASNMSPHATSFYPSADTVESVIGSAFEEDLGLVDLSLAANIAGPPVDIPTPHDTNNDDSNSVCSSLSSGFHVSSGLYGVSSVPVTIPAGGMNRNSLSTTSQSPATSPQGFTSSLYGQQRHGSLEQSSMSFLNQPLGNYSGSSFYSQEGGISPPAADLTMASGSIFNGGIANDKQEISRLREELGNAKRKLMQWEESIRQARGACDAWKREAEDAGKRMKQLEEEKLLACQQRDEFYQQYVNLKQEGRYLHCLQHVTELRTLPPNHLKQLQTQLTLDLHTLELVLMQSPNISPKCEICHDRTRPLSLLPCVMHVFCDLCQRKGPTQCPTCARRTNTNPNPTTSTNMPPSGTLPPQAM